jgi:lipopolysaccharide transport system permease protein
LDRNKISGSPKYEWLKEFWQYRELFYFFVWRDIKVRYKQTLLGALWAIIQPFFTMVVFTIFFGKFANMPSEGVPYPVFSYSALVPWTFFSGAVILSGNSLIGNSNLLTKVYFPRFVIPASAVLSGLLDYFIASALLFGILIYYQISIRVTLVFYPVLVVPLVLLALGIGMIFSSLNVKYRDVKYAIPFFIQLWMFASPIIYPLSNLPERYRTIAAINPLTGIIETYRSIVIPGKQIDPILLVYSIAASVIIFILGMIYFFSAEKRFSDNI